MDDGMMRMRIVRLTFPSWHRRYAEKDALRDSWVYVRQYCAKIDEAARNRIELIVQSLAEQNGVTEQLKADTKWSGYGR